MEPVIHSYFAVLFDTTSSLDSDIQHALRRLRHKVPPELNVSLKEPFTDEELQKALKGMHLFKSPGPDGMSPVFFHKFWHIFGLDITPYVLKFRNTCKIDRMVNKTFIFLLPKVDNPATVSQFCHIRHCH